MDRLKKYRNNIHTGFIILTIPSLIFLIFYPIFYILDIALNAYGMLVGIFDSIFILAINEIFIIICFGLIMVIVNKFKYLYVKKDLIKSNSFIKIKPSGKYLNQKMILTIVLVLSAAIVILKYEIIKKEVIENNVAKYEMINARNKYLKNKL